MQEDHQEHPPEAVRRAGVLAVTSYLLVAVLVLTEKLGQTTSDTRLDLTDAPTQFLRDTFSLWNPRVSLGELQNQAYGYLFPQGPFFAGFHELGVAPWLTQRLWSVLVLLVAAEGLRRVARALNLGPYAALVAGLAYALTPRMVAEVGVRSAEILPGAVLPWALLPLLHAVTGRMRPAAAVVLSAAAYAFAGGVNGTATAAPAALLVVVVVWAVLRRHLSWRAGLGWGALMGVANLWWAVSLLRLGAYSPPFFDYVEDARATTRSAGFSGALRGSSNWVDYIVVGDTAWWPAGYAVSFNGWIVLGSGLVAVVGVMGLMLHRGLFRVPLLASALLGVTCLSIAHTGTLDGPFAQHLKDLLDGPLAPLRNVAKADPLLRLPVAIGVAVALGELGRVARAPTSWTPGRASLRSVAAGGLCLTMVASVLAMAWPLVRGTTRTPGWDDLPDHWTQAAEYLDESPRDGAAWIVPGSGFGIQTWGWTMEEPMQVLGETPWVTRSQVPLTPSPTIGMLSGLEEYLSTGAGSPYLSSMLERVGIDRIVLRHDLDTEVALSTPSNLVAVALARSPGIRRVETFGRLTFGPAIEVFEVEDSSGDSRGEDQHHQVRDVEDTVTVASSVQDAVRAVGSGIVGADQAIVVPGDVPGWERPVDVQGDAFQRRERAFGRVHSAESGLMTAEDPYRGDRVVPNYPGPDDAEPVVAAYDGIAGVTASSSAGFVDVLGEVRPESAPWAALDGDAGTYWMPAPFNDPVGQYVEIDLGEQRRLDEVTLTEANVPLALQHVTRWRVSAGGTAVEADADPFTGRTTLDLDGVEARTLRVEVAGTEDQRSQVGLAEIEVEGLEVSRTAVLPEVDLAERAEFLFNAAPETRTCLPTLLGPDCDPLRSRASEEAAGIDRTLTVPEAGEWRMHGLVVGRSRQETARLLRPYFSVRVDGSSWLGQDPAVSPRSVHDDDPTTSWVADPRDRRPSLTIDLGRVRRIERLTIARPPAPAVAPTSATIAGGGEERTVDLTGGGGDVEPFRARRLTVTFESADDGATAIGVAELRLGRTRIAVPLDGAVRSGAVCGFGPPLVVDGRRYPTRVEGQMGAVVAGGQLAVEPCGRTRRLRLDAGQHRVRLDSTAEFLPVALRLRPTGDGAPVTRSRTLELLEQGDTRRVLDVGPGEDAIISVPQSFNDGWVARADGEVLTAIQVDGWAQGWLVPEDVSGEVVLTFDPQRPYLVGLLGGLGLLALLLLAALAVGVRTRLRPATRDPRLPDRPGTRARWDRRRVARWAVACGVVGYVVGGPLVAAGGAAGVLLARRARLAQGLAVGLLAGAVVATVVSVTRGGVYAPDGADLATGAGLAVALAAAAAASSAGARHDGRPAGGG